jgi:hypothetical protein
MASHLTSSHWIVTVPNELGSSKATLDCIAKGMAAAADGRNLGGSSLLRFHILRPGSQLTTRSLFVQMSTPLTSRR